jgi:tRNA pseudouridine38-40 synthase
MAHYKLILAYDGTRFLGYQRQGSRRTVQAALESALKSIGWQDRTVISAGRTDTGVHASGQVVTFDLAWQHSLAELQRAINANLPEDVSVREISEAPAGFHPRYDAKARTYRYRIFVDETRDPLREYTAWRAWPEPDLALLKQAADLVIGQHDFKAFGRAMEKGESTERIIWESRWETAEEKAWEYEIKANAFLYHMVRRIVFLLVRAGQGKLPLEELRSAVLSGKKILPGLAPPNGLTLVRVDYAEDTQELGFRLLQKV